MKQVKGIPYGISNFEQVRNEGKYYVDKTMYLPLLEETGNYLFLIRPRRFGKAVIRLCAGTRLHLIKLVFRGAQLVVCEER